MKLPTIPIEERKNSFKEVELTLTKEQAVSQAARCLTCPTPTCIEGCPARINIPEFMKAFARGDITKAVEVIRERNFFPSICGRICQHERMCEGHCIYAKDGDPVLVGAVERYIGDNGPQPKGRNLVGKNIAVIGSGPTGLSVAAYLSIIGMRVTVFESSNSMGGVMKYGVPEFRLPKAVVSRDLTGLQGLGIDFEPNSKIGDESLENLSKKFDAVFIGTGVGKPRDLVIPGSGLKGVLSAMKLLINLNQSALPMITPGDKVAVIGAGYVGLDAARSALRLGGDVTCIAQTTEEESRKKVAPKDYEESQEEGVKFVFGVKIKEIKGNGKVESILYENGNTFELPCTKVVYAIGQEHDDDSLKAPLRTGKDGRIEVNEEFQTRVPNVFAAGDVVHGPRTVIHAIDAGRKASQAIIKYLDKRMADEEMGIESDDKPQKAVAKIDHTNKDI